MVPVKQEGPLAVNHMSSIIIEEEEDDKSYHEGARKMESTLGVSNRMTLSPEGLRKPLQ